MGGLLWVIPWGALGKKALGFFRQGPAPAGPESPGRWVSPFQKGRDNIFLAILFQGFYVPWENEFPALNFSPLKSRLFLWGAQNPVVLASPAPRSWLG